jgi:hypothetical protein
MRFSLGKFYWANEIKQAKEVVIQPVKVGLETVSGQYNLDELPSYNARKTAFYPEGLIFL